FLLFIPAVYPPLNVPAANMFGNVPGYEAGSGGYLPPPMPVEPVTPPQRGSVPDSWSIPSLSEDVAREAFKNFVSSQCCYSSSPANEGVITKMEPYNTFRYRLETFTESRSTEWTHKPHEGEMADFNTQTAPLPWEIKATPPNLFTNHKQELRIPFTSSVKVCPEGRKSIKNQTTKEMCVCVSVSVCRCTMCNAQGMKECQTCKGKQRLLTFIQLKVEWTNHVEDFMVEQNSGLKADELHSANGKELLKISQYLFPNPTIAEASERLIKEHQSNHGQTSRILQQRQTVELIPITKVNYSWKGASHVYVVYGNNNHVSAENYPATCCCVIL
uniref:Ssu-2 homolog n=1 Tax=Monopterus albus TaxID=43700 RepID=A0A3Q3KF16_MONAL